MRRRFTFSVSESSGEAGGVMADGDMSGQPARRYAKGW